ncbi:MAG TPA: acyl-CoA dehydrogenase [Nitriliruptorales bacterium]
MANPVLDDREIDFLLHDVLDVEQLTKLDHFADHSRETYDAVVEAARRVARDVLFPGYRSLDEQPPVFSEGRIRVADELRPMWERLVELGMISAARPYEVGGQQVPLSVLVAAKAWLMAANAAAYGYVGLTSGAAHLIEEFGSDELREQFMSRMYSGEWTGTMALTEPHAGSSLGDLASSASPRDDGTYSIHGSKIFISAGDHDLTDNIVHLALARIDGAPAGTRGISLFAVPKRRPGPDGELVDNDVSVTGMIHKIGWKGLPSLALSFGERDDCVGWLVGEPNRGLAYMFQMMNEARLMVGLNGVATAAVAYQESLAYARERPQGRSLTDRDPDSPQVPIIEHTDVRRMLLRQKAIVDGGLTLVLTAAMQADLAAHGATDQERSRAQRLLDVLTPVVKSFPAEAGFESNVLAVQVFGGYGYSSEYLPEAWLRDQKLNSIHEGTTGIQSIDLLGRRAMAGEGAGLATLSEAIAGTVQRAAEAGVDLEMCSRMTSAVQELVGLTADLGVIGAAGEADRMLRHSVDYLDLFSVVVIAWQHLLRAAAAAESTSIDDAFRDGVQRATRYWFATEVPRVTLLAERIRSGEDSFATMDPSSF